LETSFFLFPNTVYETGSSPGDLLDKPHANGRLSLSRFYASAILAAFIIACILFLPQKAGEHPGES
jgi:uncharacterized membrane-anchored protein